MAELKERELKILSALSTVDRADKANRNWTASRGKPLEHRQDTNRVGQG